MKKISVVLLSAILCFASCTKQENLGTSGNGSGGSSSGKCSTVQCSGTTAAGKRCQNKTTDCSGRCYQH